MSVSLYVGATESGKSYFVKHKVIPLWKKVIVFDPADCFEGDAVLVAPSNEVLKKTLAKFLDKEKFRIVIKTNGSCKDDQVFRSTVILAKYFGMYFKKKGATERIQVVVDEVTASKICSSGSIHPELEWLVCKGRHEILDCHLITQYPMAINNLIRTQVTKFVCFYLNNAEGVTVIRSVFKREIAEKISEFPSYHRMEWTNKGTIYSFDENDKITGDFSRKSEEIQQKPKRGSKKL